MTKKLALIFLILGAIVSSSVSEPSSETELVRETRSPQQYQTLLYYAPPRKPPTFYKVRRSVDESETDLVREARSPQRYQTLLYHPPPQPVKIYRTRRSAEPLSETELVRAARSPQHNLIYSTSPTQSSDIYRERRSAETYQTLPYYYPDEFENFKHNKLELFPNPRPRPLTWPKLTPNEQN